MMRIKLLELYTDWCEWFGHQSFLFLILPPHPYSTWKSSNVVCVYVLIIVVIPLFLEGAGDGSEVVVFSVLPVEKKQSLTSSWFSHLWWYSSLSCHPRVFLRPPPLRMCFIWDCQIVKCGTTMLGSLLLTTVTFAGWGVKLHEPWLDHDIVAWSQVRVSLYLSRRRTVCSSIVYSCLTSIV